MHNNFVLSSRNWIKLVEENDTNVKYDIFLKTYSELFDLHFPLKTIKIKKKNLVTPWMTKGMKKSSKMKQKLYIKYLKDIRLKENYLTYKNMFEKLKANAKQNYYSSLLSKYKNNSRKTWEVMKELTGKQKLKSSSLPKQIKKDGTIIDCEFQIAQSFNDFFVNVGPSLAKKIKKPNRCFTSYLEISQNELAYFDLTL